jgi:ABC-type branched-subunit amino acid transport system substrate-binding protein
MWLAGRLAVEQANESGGYRGARYRLVPAWSEDPWGSGAAEIARAVYSDGVWAIVGSIDGASTHLAEQIVAKARLPLISPGSTDKTVNLANVAWMFSCLPPDDVHAHVLAEALVERVGGRPFTLVSATDHDSHVATVELEKSLTRLAAGPLLHLEFESRSADLEGLARRVTADGPSAVVLQAGPIDAARLVSLLRDLDADVPILGGPSMGRRIFLERAGEAAEGVLFPLSCDPSMPSGRFSRTFLSRYGRLPDCKTAQTYDAIRLLIDAIEDAGLNRARIRDALQSLSPWSGVAGTIEWSSLGLNRREVHLATIRQGRVESLNPPEE